MIMANYLWMPLEYIDNTFTNINKDDSPPVSVNVTQNRMAYHGWSIKIKNVLLVKLCAILLEVK